MNNKVKILLAAPLVLIILFLFIAHSITYDQSLSETESQMLDFISLDVQLKDKTAGRLDTVAEGPFEFSRQTMTVQSDKDDRIDYNDSGLSLIVISGLSRSAIINGQIVREGESIDGMMVRKIEPQRVLIKNKTTKWLYLENNHE